MLLSNIIIDAVKEMLFSNINSEIAVITQLLQNNNTAVAMIGDYSGQTR